MAKMLCVKGQVKSMLYEMSNQCDELQRVLRMTTWLLNTFAAYESFKIRDELFFSNHELMIASA